MKRLILSAIATLGLLTHFGIAPAFASNARDYVVQPGDTLTGIARHHSVGVSQLARTNGLHPHSWVYVGQRLVVPGDATQIARIPSSRTYVVQPGDTLAGIALRHGTGTAHLARANGLRWNAWVYVGQRLEISGKSRVPGALPSNHGTTGEKWIDVDLGAQRLVAYEGVTPVFESVVSTGLPATPTVVGEFRIWVKFVADDMAGPGYYLADVPYVMYFHRGYGIHGTYWHASFGTPMSHGCVNLSIADAKRLFSWAPMGTRVVTHY